MKAQMDGTISPGTATEQGGGPEGKVEVVHEESIERKLAEELSEQISRNRLVLQTAIDGYFLVDEAGTIMEVNPAASAIYGYSQEELIGMSIRRLDADDPEKVRDELRRIRKEGAIRFETRQRCNDGRIVVVEGSIHTVEAGEQRFFCSFFHDITEKKQAEQMLIEKEKELHVKNINLEETNIALKVLLKKREEDKTELERKVMANIDLLVKPYIEKMRERGLNENQKAYLNVLESNLNDITSHFSLSLSSMHLSLTPTEIKIANLIRLGRTTKEIADMLNVSTETIEVHRKRIRDKFGIKNKKTNLATYLLSLNSYGM
jgi:PAS domain S-box-containing protein